MIVTLQIYSVLASLAQTCFYVLGVVCMIKFLWGKR